MLCFPSHTTHLLQPNDAGFNKAFKENLDAMLLDSAEANLGITMAEFANMCYASLHLPNISKSIVSSFAHTGVYPYNNLRITALLRAENVDEKLEKDPILRLATQHLLDHLRHLEELKAEKAKRAEEVPKRKKIRFPTSNARLLTSADSIAAMKEALKIEESQMMRADNPRKLKLKKDLLLLVEKVFQDNWSTTLAKYTDLIKQYRVPAPVFSLV